MKYFIHNCFFILIIIFFAYINTKQEKEAFTPKINGFVRPYIRNTRIFSEGLYEKQKINISNFLRKYGLM